MNEQKPPIAVIMAAGKSTRMKSATPKVLHPLAGRAVIDFVIQSAVDGCGVTDTVAMVGYERERVRAYLSGRWKEGVRFAVQDPQHGTGHAVMQAEALLDDWDGDVLTLAGDTPLLTPDVLRALLERHRETNAAATILTAQMDDPASYGRIVRDADGGVARIVETKDATPEERGITEINTSIYCFQAKPLFEMLKQVKPVNAQGEYYLTDVIALLAANGARVETVTAPDAAATMGINTRAELAEAAAIVRRRILNRLMLDGVSIVDPVNTYIDADVSIGADTVVWPGCLIEGATTIGANCSIGPHAHIVDTQLGDGVAFAQSKANLAEVADGTSVGPFAHLRPGTILGKDVRIGSFVETKKAELGDGAHVSQPFLHRGRHGRGPRQRGWRHHHLQL